VPDALRDLRDDFRQAMGGVAQSVYVVSAERGGRRLGLTATAVASLSMAPPAILVCVNQSASIHADLLEAGCFCLNALRADQRDIAKIFGSSGVGEARFEVGDWRTLGGAPALDRALANILCRTVEARAFATHTVLIGQVEAIKLDPDAEPLIYCRGAFR
jgi:flavin reductase (DIM6/NTAB) family NADH-FMN oxidoreductase RutF